MPAPTMIDIHLAPPPIFSFGVSHCGSFTSPAIAKLFDQERHIVFGNLRARDEVHHLAQIGGGRLRRKLTTARKEIRDDLLGQNLHFGLFCFRPSTEAAVRKHIVVRFQIVPQMIGITRNVRKRNQQRWQVRLIQRIIQP